MEQNLNDKTACLVTAFQSGDVSAFSTLYDMHINLLFNYGCKLTTDKELLKDCIHDVFVKLYTKKAELGIIDNFKSYLLISLKNKLCDELRRRMFMSETAVEELNPVAAGDDVEHQYLEKEKSCFENIKVKHLLAQLSPRQREALTLYYIEETHYSERMIANMSKASALVDVSKKRVNPFKELWTNKFLYLLALPAVVYTFIFSYLTLPYIVIAFEKFNYKTGVFSPFVGLKNFEYFFKSSWAWTVTRNTLVINILFLIVGTVCSVVLAIVLNEVKAKKFLKVSQSMMLFPYFISWVIVSYMLQGILGTETGLLNNLMGTRINYYSTPGYWYPILLILNIWKNTGYNTIVYLAAITGIDEGLYEAAYIDGATRFKRIIYITIPLLAPTICIMTLMSVGRIFYGDFGMLYAIIRDNSSLMPIAEVIDTYAVSYTHLTLPTT